MLQHLLPQTQPPVLQPQIGHGAPLTHLIAPGGVSPQLLVSIDEAWELKLWHLAHHSSADAEPVEYLSVALRTEVLQARWCEQIPGRLWCLSPEGHLGYYDFDLVNHEASFHDFVSLPPASVAPLQASSTALGFCQSAAKTHHSLWILSPQGLWHTALSSTSAITLLKVPSEKEFAQAIQVQMQATPDGLYLAILSPHQAEVFQIMLPEAATEASCRSVFRGDLDTPATADTAFLLSPQGHYLAIDRHVYTLEDSPEDKTGTQSTARHTYYGRPLAFFEAATPAAKPCLNPCLLWASGDTLFTTALTEQGEILHHQEMQYSERYSAWPIFWSFAVSDTRNEVPTFWVADHHRHNASQIIAPLHQDTLLLIHSLVGEGGWVESLCFSAHNRLYVGGGQKGTLCQLQVHPTVTLSQHFIAPPQPVETLWKLPLKDRELLLTLSAGGLRCYDAQLSQAIDILAPPAPWHKALENGALEQLAVLPTGWVAQFAYKGKVSVQHYDIQAQRWQILSQKLPEQAVLLAAISEQELLMEHDNPTGLFKLYFPLSQKWQDLPCELEAFDQILWSHTQQLLAILLEGEIEVWHHQAPGQWVCCHHIYQDTFFNGMAFAESTAELFTLDNEGRFKRWELQIHNPKASQGRPVEPRVIHQTTLSHWGPDAEDRVVSISTEGTFIALGDRDQALRLWDGTTGQLYATVLACVNTDGSTTELAVL